MYFPNAASGNEWNRMATLSIRFYSLHPWVHCALYKFVIFEIFVVEKKHPKLILFIVLFVPIDECLVDLFHAAWSGVVAAEVPVAGVMGTGSVESFE